MSTIPDSIQRDVSDPDRSKGRIDAALFGWLILCATLPYFNTLFNGFVYDDNRQVLDNPYLKSFHYLPKIFGTTVWSFVGAQGVSNYYRPIMTLGYLLCYRAFGPLAYGFHLVSVGLHVGVTCLVFVVARRMFHGRFLAFVGAWLFALHPIHTESVAWIAAVTDVEVTFFYLLTFWLFLQVARPGGRRSAWTELAMVVSFALTIFSKEQALTFPLLATVYEHLYREDRFQTSWRQKAARYSTLWLMDFAYVLFRIVRLGAFAPQVQLTRLGWSATFSRRWLWWANMLPRSSGQCICPPIMFFTRARRSPVLKCWRGLPSWLSAGPSSPYCGGAPGLFHSASSGSL